MGGVYWSQQMLSLFLLYLYPQLMKVGGGILESADGRLVSWSVGEMLCLKLLPQFPSLAKGFQSYASYFL